MSAVPAEVDVLVVGGGPAGLSAAAAAAARGASVHVVERNAAIGEPVRTSGGSFIAPMRALGVPREMLHPVKSLRLVGPGHELVFRRSRAMACVIDVRGTYQHLAARAADSGAGITLRASVSGPLTGPDGRVRGVRLRTGEEIRARHVVDSSGSVALAARAVGARHGADRRAVGVEWEVHAPRYDQDEALLAVGDEIAPGGYAWAFPCGRDRVRLGVGVVRPDSDADPQRLLETLVDAVPSLASCRHSAPLEIHAGVMPAMAPDAVRLVSPGLVVAGDAGGQGSTLLGEGIRYSIIAGRMAGDAVGRAVSRPDREAEELGVYPRRWHASVGRQMRAGWLMHGRLCAYSDDDWRRVLAVVSRLTAWQVMAVLAGSLDYRLAANLVLTRPGLVVGEGRALLRAALARPGAEPSGRV
ncbi:MAG TPA: NAD(P)/FAD-dependent oxidoreductase [Acidimicrobiales bacterium]|nr:NAD(P)/FAD-dependent oxidoreductase [Acidimicrobiales bacterium]